MLPFSLGCAVFSAVSGVLVSRTGQYRIVMWIAYPVFALGMGLMIMLDANSSTCVLYFYRGSMIVDLWIPISSAVKVIFPLIAAIGLGCLFQVSIWS